MRYFVCTSAGRPYIAGGQTFTFDPVGHRGGSLLGVLAVEEPAASILAESGIPQIGEISEQRYNDEKKKVAQQQRLSTGSPVLPQTGNPLIPPRGAEVVARPTIPVSAEKLSSETLELTDKQPPPEPLLEERTPPARPTSKE